MHKSQAASGVDHHTQKQFNEWASSLGVAGGPASYAVGATGGSPLRAHQQSHQPATYASLYAKRVGQALPHGGSGAVSADSVPFPAAPWRSQQYEPQQYDFTHEPARSPPSDPWLVPSAQQGSLSPSLSAIRRAAAPFQPQGASRTAAPGPGPISGSAGQPPYARREGPFPLTDRPLQAHHQQRQDPPVSGRLSHESPLELIRRRAAGVLGVLPIDTPATPALTEWRQRNSARGYAPRPADGAAAPFREEPAPGPLTSFSGQRERDGQPTAHKTKELERELEDLRTQLAAAKHAAQGAMVEASRASAAAIAAAAAATSAAKRRASVVTSGDSHAPRSSESDAETAQKRRPPHPTQSQPQHAPRADAPSDPSEARGKSHARKIRGGGSPPRNGTGEPRRGGVGSPPRDAATQPQQSRERNRSPSARDAVVVPRQSPSETSAQPYSDSTDTDGPPRASPNHSEDGRIIAHPPQFHPVPHRPSAHAAPPAPQHAQQQQQRPLPSQQQSAPPAPPPPMALQLTIGDLVGAHVAPAKAPAPFPTASTPPAPPAPPEAPLPLDLTPPGSEISFGSLSASPSLLPDNTARPAAPAPASTGAAGSAAGTVSESPEPSSGSLLLERLQQIASAPDSDSDVSGESIRVGSSVQGHAKPPLRPNGGSPAHGNEWEGEEAGEEAEVQSPAQAPACTQAPAPVTPRGESAPPPLQPPPQQQQQQQQLSAQAQAQAFIRIPTTLGQQRSPAPAPAESAATAAAAAAATAVAPLPAPVSPRTEEGPLRRTRADTHERGADPSPPPDPESAPEHAPEPKSAYEREPVLVVPEEYAHMEAEEHWVRDTAPRQRHPAHPAHPAAHPETRRTPVPSAAESFSFTSSSGGTGGGAGSHAGGLSREQSVDSVPFAGFPKPKPMPWEEEEEEEEQHQPPPLQQQQHARAGPPPQPQPPQRPAAGPAAPSPSTRAAMLLSLAQASAEEDDPPSAPCSPAASVPDSPLADPEWLRTPSLTGSDGGSGPDSDEEDVMELIMRNAAKSALPGAAAIPSLGSGFERLRELPETGGPIMQSPRGARPEGLYAVAEKAPPPQQQQQQAVSAPVPAPKTPGREASPVRSGVPKPPPAPLSLAEPAQPPEPDADTGASVSAADVSVELADPHSGAAEKSKKSKRRLMPEDPSWGPIPPVPEPSSHWAPVPPPVLPGDRPGSFRTASSGSRFARSGSGVGGAGGAEAQRRPLVGAENAVQVTPGPGPFWWGPLESQPEPANMWGPIPDKPRPRPLGRHAGGGGGGGSGSGARSTGGSEGASDSDLEPSSPRSPKTLMSPAAHAAAPGSGPGGSRVKPPLLSTVVEGGSADSLVAVEAAAAARAAAGGQDAKALSPLAEELSPGASTQPEGDQQRKRRDSDSDSDSVSMWSSDVEGPPDTIEDNGAAAAAGAGAGGRERGRESTSCSSDGERGDEVGGERLLPRSPEAEALASSLFTKGGKGKGQLPLPRKLAWDAGEGAEERGVVPEPAGSSAPVAADTTAAEAARRSSNGNSRSSSSSGSSGGESEGEEGEGAAGDEARPTSPAPVLMEAANGSQAAAHPTHRPPQEHHQQPLAPEPPQPHSQPPPPPPPPLQPSPPPPPLPPLEIFSSPVSPPEDPPPPPKPPPRGHRLSGDPSVADLAGGLADAAERGGGFDRLELGRNPTAAQALQRLGGHAVVFSDLVFLVADDDSFVRGALVVTRSVIAVLDLTSYDALWAAQYNELSSLWWPNAPEDELSLATYSPGGDCKLVDPRRSEALGAIILGLRKAARTAPECRKLPEGCELRMYYA